MAYKMSKLEPAEQKEQLAKMLKAADGVKGKRRRGKKMRAATGEQKMRTKKEVEKMIKMVKRSSVMPRRVPSNCFVGFLAESRSFSMQRRLRSRRSRNRKSQGLRSWHHRKRMELQQSMQTLRGRG